ncbi:MAG TPA: septum formation initiator family protein [Opitutaceae bacterium]|nr:septum formation initiator family protein [Opitutaceae bacterium]
MNVRRIIFIIYIVIFGVLGLFATLFLKRTRDEYIQLQAQQAACQKRLGDAELKLKEQQKILDKLRTDPAYVEKIIRQKLNYAKPGELIFRFEDTR